MLEEASAPLGRNAAPKFSVSVSIRADMTRTARPRRPSQRRYRHFRDPCPSVLRSLLTQPH